MPSFKTVNKLVRCPHNIPENPRVGADTKFRSIQLASNLSLKFTKSPLRKTLEGLVSHHPGGAPRLSRRAESQEGGTTSRQPARHHGGVAAASSLLQRGCYRGAATASSPPQGGALRPALHYSGGAAGSTLQRGCGNHNQ